MGKGDSPPAGSCVEVQQFRLLSSPFVGLLVERRAGLKGNLEIFIFRVVWYLFDSYVFYISAEFLFDVPQAVFYIFQLTLSNHFHRSVRHVADRTGQPAAAGHVKCRKSEADTLDKPVENNLSGYMAHWFYDNPKNPEIQASMRIPACCLLLAALQTAGG